MSDDMIENKETLKIEEKREMPRQENNSNNRKGLMITGIVFFALAAIFAVLTIVLFCYMYISAIKDDSGLVGAIALVFMFSYGLFSYIPALIFSIISTSILAVSKGSSDKKIKTISKILMILSIVMIVILVLILVLLFTLQPVTANE